MTIEIVEHPRDVRRRLLMDFAGLVPTMGALHEGHLSLTRRCAAENKRAVVSIFVNPLQFNDARDLEAYPRNFERDVRLAEEAGADLIFAPTPALLYPEGFSTTVAVAGLSERWEGAVRPGHFAGVTTVVSKLFNIVDPSRVYFGEKDFQQLAIIRRMRDDLNWSCDIIGCPTVRDADGLALSSRNSRLSAEQRAIAAIVPRTLFAMRDRANAGDRVADSVIEHGLAMLAQEPTIAVDYLAIVDPETLDPVEEVQPGSRALIAVRLGAVRLIDNLGLLELLG